MDQPAASHDMLLRFLQVDTMHSAGSAARIPSRIGSQTETVLGATHPNGTSLYDLLNLGSGDGADTGSEGVEGAGGGIVIGTEGDDIEHERKYGPRKTAALVGLLVLLGVGIWVTLLVRRRRRRQRYQRLKGKGRATSRRHAEVEYDESDTLEAAGPSRRRSIPSIAVFDVGEYEEDADDSRHSYSRRFSDEVGEDDPERAGDIGRAADGANPFREDDLRRYEEGLRS